MSKRVCVAPDASSGVARSAMKTLMLFEPRAASPNCGDPHHMNEGGGVIWF